MLQVMDIFAGTNGGASRNWSTDLLALYKGIHERGEKALADVDSKRVAGTSPTLPLASYVGTFVHPVWGDLVIAQFGGELRVSLGPKPGNRGTLEHFHYDTFRASLGDGRAGRIYLMFQIDGEGKARHVTMNGDDGYVFTRVAARR